LVACLVPEVPGDKIWYFVNFLCVLTSNLNTYFCVKVLM
jgi:hypothetical protein